MDRLDRRIADRNVFGSIADNPVPVETHLAVLSTVRLEATDRSCLRVVPALPSLGAI